MHFLCYIDLQQDAVTEKPMTAPAYGGMAGAMAAAPAAINGVGGGTITTGKKKKKVSGYTTHSASARH